MKKSVWKRFDENFLARIFEFECRKTDVIILQIIDLNDILYIYFRLYTHILYWKICFNFYKNDVTSIFWGVFLLLKTVILKYVCIFAIKRRRLKKSKSTLKLTLHRDTHFFEPTPSYLSLYCVFKEAPKYYHKRK